MCFLLDRLFDWLVAALLYIGSRLYRWVISPVIHTLAGPGYGCRFQPSCGDYAHQALRDHGLFKGGFLALRRLLSCHPFSGRSGYDPVPPASASKSSTCCACSGKQAVLSPISEDHHGS